MGNALVNWERCALEQCGSLLPLFRWMLARACWRLRFRAANSLILGRPQPGNKCARKQAVENCHGAKPQQVTALQTLP